jgi:DNA-binding XRE family transcriptional regulator
MKPRSDLYYARRLRELSQSDLARKLRVHRVTYTQIESGARRPMPLLAVRIAVHLHLTPERFWSMWRKAALGRVRSSGATESAARASTI